MPDSTDDTGSNAGGQPAGLNSFTSSVSLTLRREHALHGLAGEVVTAIEPISEADPAALLLHFLAMFGMRYPVVHVNCGQVHDASGVKVLARYADCDIWECPNCHVQCDNRPIGWGGNVRRLDRHGRITE